MDLDAAVANNSHDVARKLLKAIEELHTYIENNQGLIPNYGERYWHSERISTSFVVSEVPFLSPLYGGVTPHTQTLSKNPDLVIR
jgi:hypothetical protein